MRRPTLLRSAAGMLALAGVSVQWMHFTSRTYPYTISRPSSFRYAPARDGTGLKFDYFFPPIGSFTTNVNVCALRGTHAGDEAAYLRSQGGRNVRLSWWVKINGRRHPVYQAHFAGPADSWTLEQTTFVAGSRVWRLTVSYSDRHTSMRALLRQMLRSVHLR